MERKNLKIKNRRKNKLKKYLYTSILSFCLVGKAASQNNDKISYAQNIENPTWGGGSLIEEGSAKKIANYYKEFIEFNKNYKREDSEDLFAGINHDIYFYKEPDYGFPVTPEYQDYIRSMANKYHIPFEILMVTFDQESNGHWNNVGKISPTDDYGVPQINKKTIDTLITPNLGYTRDEVLNDPYKGAEAGAYVIKYIWRFLGYDLNNFSYYNTFGSYNGWIDFKNNTNCIDYANTCMQRLKNHFDITDEEINNPSLRKHNR